MTEAVITYMKGMKVVAEQSINNHVHSRLLSTATIPDEMLDVAVPALGGLMIDHTPRDTSASDPYPGMVFIRTGAGLSRKITVSIAPGEQADFPIPGSSYVIHINHK